MKLYSVNSGFFKLDGGAMHGVVPRSLWQKFNPADENNMCSWALRSLLIETDGHLILVDNGMGDKQDAKFFGHYYLHGNDSMDKCLSAHGFTRADVSDVLLTHLHFDHCGGSIRNNEQGLPEAAFPNARYWSNRKHWQWATEPNNREKASFLKENILPIMESGRLNFVEYEKNNEPVQRVSEVFPGVDILIVDGHTEGMMLPVAKTGRHTVAYMADLLPSVAHIPLPWIMSYDTRPLLTLKEKEIILKEALEGDYILFFEHDARFETCTLKQTDKGIRADRMMRLSEALGMSIKTG